MRGNSRKVGGDNIMGIEVGLRHFYFTWRQ